MEAEPLDSDLLQAIVTSAVDGIITIDAEGTVRTVNPAVERLFGYRSDEVIGRNIRMLMPEPYRAEHDAYLQRYHETGERRIIGVGREVHGKRKDGSVFPMYLSVAEVPWGPKKLFAGIVHDLSARTRSEEQLKREKERAQRYLDIAGAMIVALGEDESIQLINRRGADILGVEAEACIGRNWFDTFVPASIREAMRAKFRRAVAGDPQATEYSESAVLTAHGIERTIAWHHALLRDDDGRITGTLRSGEDVTELKRAVGEMQRMRGYLKNIIDSMPSVLVGVDALGRITEWNLGAEQLTGVAPDAAMGRRFDEMLPQLASQLDNIRDAIARREPVRSERQAAEADGEVQYSDIVVYPLVANCVVGAVIRVDDVTNRVRIEQMMVQTEKMMSVGGLAAGMAHEINNPLSAVLQGCQNIGRRISPELAGNVEEARRLGIDLATLNRYLDNRGVTTFLEGIRDAGTRATRIVADMLAFSRRSDQRFVRVHAADMLETVVRLVGSDYDLKKSYDFRQIRIEHDFDPATPPIHCDRTEIEQVFLNIVKNAAQAMADAAKPLPHRITLRTRAEPAHVRIEIEDNGPGMDPKAARRVFEPFFTTKPVGVGTGLGLSVSYFIVTEHHGGTISVDSTPGEGTCFVVRLPIEPRLAA